MVGVVFKHVMCRSHVFSSVDEKNLGNVFHCDYLKNGKHFLGVLENFRNLQKVLCMFKKKISFIA